MRRLTTEEFVNKCRLVHGNKFDYSSVQYKNTRTDILVVCKKHGEFKIQASNHLHSKQGCWNCFLDMHRLTKLSEERLNNLKRTHNNKYTYLDISVVKGFIKIECPEHGEFKQYLYFHEYGHGCSDCNSSKGEEKIKSYLEKKESKFFRNFKFDDCSNQKKLRFDFWLPDFNLVIEYDGEHHFKENKYFGEGNLDYMKKNDSIKNEYCHNNKINLLRIPYWKFKEIEDILNNYFDLKSD